MRIRPVSLALALLALLSWPDVAHADGHRAFFGAFSAMRSSVLFGVHAVVDAPVKAVPLFGDVSWHTGDDKTRTTVLVGGRQTLGNRPTIQNATRHSFAVHGVIGFVHENRGVGTDFALGGGVAYEFVAQRTSTHMITLRLQLDEIVRPGDPDNFERFSIGVAKRW
jgi:hypothetical protein